jgi:catechol 2,3-dioxygenase-like lactoylglutathione lyase family enzyme
MEVRPDGAVEEVIAIGAEDFDPRQDHHDAAGQATPRTENREEPLMDVQFIASFAVVTAEPERSRALYVDALGLPLDHAEGDDYYHSEQIGGSKHFGVWPLAEAALACFGVPDWPSDHQVPQGSIEFELADTDAVAAGAQELAGRGFPLLHDARTEPWGQTVARLLSPEGLIVGLSYAPWMHT